MPISSCLSLHLMRLLRILSLHLEHLIRLLLLLIPKLRPPMGTVTRASVNRSLGSIGFFVVSGSFVLGTGSCPLVVGTSVVFGPLVVGTGLSPLVVCTAAVTCNFVIGTFVVIGATVVVSSFVVSGPGFLIWDRTLITNKKSRSKVSNCMTLKTQIDK